MTLMKRISSAINTFRSFEEYDEKKWTEWNRGPLTRSGVRINEVTSLSISAVFAAINFIAGTIASLPKVVYRQKRTGGKERAFDHPLYDRLHNKPNDSGMTAWQWIYTSIIHKYLWGNWYTWIKQESYQNQEFIPLLPDRTWLDKEKDDRYITIRKDGTQTYVPRSQMLHIPHISLDGIIGKGFIHYARESLGTAKALDEFAGSYFGDGIHPGGFVEVEGPMEEETRKGLQSDFNKKYRGLGKLFKVIFLTGAKYKPEEIDPSKAQALESRQFSITEVSRWTNLPPHILKDLTRSTNNNIEHQSLELVVYSLLPLTTQIEQEMNIACFDDVERRDHLIKFELKGLLRGDLKARTEFYKLMLDRGVFNADMILDLEDINPQPNGLGKIYFVPLNMINKELIISPQPLTIENNNNPLPNRKAVQILEKRNAALRRKITIAYKLQYDEYGKRIVQKEVDAIRKAIEDMLSERGIVDFNNWLDNYYNDFGIEIETLAAPILASYAAAILPVAQEEINSDFYITPQYLDFQREYKEYFVDRHIKSSRGQLQSIIKNAQEAEENEADVIEQRLSEWEEKRPGKITMRESVRAESAFTRSVFALCGISKIVSIAYGKSCPYCQALDGKIIGIDDYFITKGEFQPDGAEKPLIVTSNCSHPPYHDGCDCGIGAGF